MGRTASTPQDEAAIMDGERVLKSAGKCSKTNGYSRSAGDQSGEASRRMVEDFAADFVEKEVAKRVDTAIDSVQSPTNDTALSRAASAIYANNEQRIDAYRESLRQKVHEQMADAIAEVRDLDCEYFYIFEQNWLLTIIFNNYLGFTYLIYLAIVFGLLCDIALNRARVTTRIVNTVCNAIGSAASAGPC